MFKKGTEYWQQFNKIQRTIIEINILITTFSWALLAISIFIMPKKDISQIGVATFIGIVLTMNMFLINRVFDKKPKHETLTKEEHLLLGINMLAPCPIYGLFALFGLLSTPNSPTESMLWYRFIGFLALLLIFFNAIFVIKTMENKSE